MEAMVRLQATVFVNCRAVSDFLWRSKGVILTLLSADPLYETKFSSLWTPHRLEVNHVTAGWKPGHLFLLLCWIFILGKWGGNRET